MGCGIWDMGYPPVLMTCGVCSFCLRKSVSCSSSTFSRIWSRSGLFLSFFGCTSGLCAGGSPVRYPLYMSVWKKNKVTGCTTTLEQWIGGCCGKFLGMRRDVGGNDKMIVKDDYRLLNREREKTVRLDQPIPCFPQKPHNAVSDFFVHQKIQDLLEGREKPGRPTGGNYTGSPAPFCCRHTAINGNDG